VECLGAATTIAEIICQDEMWKMKQSSLTHSWANANLEDVILYIRKQTNSTWEYEILGDRVQIGQFKIEKESAAKAFEKLKTRYGIYCFFRNGKLIVGKPYETDPTKWNVVELEYGRNVITWKDLIYKRKEEVQISITAVNHKPSGGKKEIHVGDVNGEVRTLDFYNLTDAALRSQALALLDLLKYDGYRGKIHCFLEPTINQGDVVNITDWRYPERDGMYFVDSVEPSINGAEGRQLVELGPLATAPVLVTGKRGGKK
jgi:hypothetical protein